MNTKTPVIPVIGRPIILRARTIASGWNPAKTYDHFFVSVPAEMVRALGWKPHDRLFPILYPGVGIFFQRIAPRVPGSRAT